MKNVRNITSAILMALVCLAAPAAAQFDLSWNTIDGGGEMFATAGGWELSGTIGQADAGGAMTGGGFELVGGFWGGSGTGVDCGDRVGDIHPNGIVELADLAILLSNFGTLGGATCLDGDIEPPGGDGNVGLSDLATLLSRFATACP